MDKIAYLEYLDMKGHAFLRLLDKAKLDLDKRLYLKKFHENLDKIKIALEK